MALDIVLHRSEALSVGHGSFSQVDVIGVSTHTDQMRSSILRLKYGKQKHVALALAHHIHEALRMLAIIPEQCIVTWAPTTEERKRRRGFDQAELIARHLGVLLHKQVKRTLRRTGTQTQTGMSRKERINSPSFIGRGRAFCPAIIIVDDVVTTGSTFRRAAEVLARDGYSRIICIAPSHKM